MKNGWKYSTLKMNEVVRDIEILENLVIAMNEGASDEKYATLMQLRNFSLRRKIWFVNLKRSFVMIRQKSQD